MIPIGNLDLGHLISILRYLTVWVAITHFPDHVGLPFVLVVGFFGFGLRLFNDAN